MSIRRSIKEQLEFLRYRNKVTEDLDYDGFLARLLGKKARPTQGIYLKSPARFKAYKGMAGAAKTSTLVADELQRVYLQPGYKGFLARQDYNDMLGTVIPRAEYMINNISPGSIIQRDKTPPMRWWIQSFDGTVNELMFIGLKNYPGGYEWHHGGVDEADEVDKRTAQGLRSRLRAPTPEGIPPSYGLGFTFNPPDELHWLYEGCTGLTHEGKRAQDGKWLTLFEPSEGENDENLPPGYYIDNFLGMPQDMLDRLKHGKWGAAFKGDPVYKQFNNRLHVVDNIPFDPALPLFRFWDFGYGHPCCIFVQMDDEYRLRVIAEVFGTDEEAKPFIERVKAFVNRNFPNCQGILDFGDPAAKQKKDTGSTLSVLVEKGIHLIFLDGMTIEEGVRRTRYLLERIVKGEPAVIFSKKNAPLTIRMMQGGYRLHTNGKPLKDGFYDHLADAFRYGITNIFAEDGRPSALPDFTIDSALEHLQGSIPDSIEYQEE